MKKSIKIIDDKRNIVQITTADERWYTRMGTDPVTQLPKVLFYASATWIAGYWPKGVEFYKWLADKGWDEAQAAKEAAGEKGSAVHTAIEMIFTGQELRIDTKVLDRGRSTEADPVYRELTAEEIWCIRTFQDCVRELELDYVVETLATEMTLISDLLKVAGTMDWAVKLTPKPAGKDPVNTPPPKGGGFRLRLEAGLIDPSGR
jgi:hypothetical protein